MREDPAVPTPSLEEICDRIAASWERARALGAESDRLLDEAQARLRDQRQRGFPTGSGRSRC
jgi:hypothetical protein